MLKESNKLDNMQQVISSSPQQQQQQTSSIVSAQQEQQQQAKVSSLSASGDSKHSPQDYMMLM
jgi:hypothetical protein